MSNPGADATIVIGLTAPEAETRALADRLGEALDGDTASLGVFEAEPGTWRLAVYCMTADVAASVRSLVSDIAGAKTAERLVTEQVAQRDWVAASLAGLSPVRAGRFFVHGAHDRARVPKNAIAIEIEAALAFGTGHHGTTLGCLLAIEWLFKARRPRRVLDVGTGTGVLAIAVARAARRAVLASDIDRQAVGVARANARANGAAGFVTTIHATGLRGARFARGAPYDLVLANILLGPLQRLAAPMARLTTPDGSVVLSGLLPRQANAVLSAYRGCGLTLDRRIEREGWTTLILTRGGRAASKAKTSDVAARGLS